MKSTFAKNLSLVLVAVGSFIAFNKIVRAADTTVTYKPGDFINVDNTSTYAGAQYFIVKDGEATGVVHNPAIAHFEDGTKDGTYGYCIDIGKERAGSETTYTKTLIQDNPTYKDSGDKFRTLLYYLYENGLDNTRLATLFANLKLDSPTVTDSAGVAGYSYAGSDAAHSYVTHSSTAWTAGEQQLVTAAQALLWNVTISENYSGLCSGVDPAPNCGSGTTATRADTNKAIYNNYTTLSNLKTLTIPSSYDIQYNVTNKTTTYNTKTEKYDVVINYTINPSGYMSTQDYKCTDGTVTSSNNTYTCKTTIASLDDSVELSTVGTKVPDVYVLTGATDSSNSNAAVQDFVVMAAPGTETKTTKVNFDAKTAILKITKKDKDGNLLKDVLFELYDKDKNKVGSCTTDDKGYCEIKSLSEGNYTVKEAKTPSGYTGAKDETITIDKTILDKGYIAITVLNDKIVVETPEKSPETGDKSVMIISTSLLTAVSVLFAFRKKLALLKLAILK